VGARLNNCPVVNCKFRFTSPEASDPYIAFEILKHIIDKHELVEA